MYLFPRAPSPSPLCKNHINAKAAVRGWGGRLADRVVEIDVLLLLSLVLITLGISGVG